MCCTIENQKNADYKLSIFKDLPIKHKCITAQPLLEKIDIKEQCIRKNVNFEFRQCGTYTIKDGKQYKIQTKDLCKQAKLANIDYKINCKKEFIFWK